MHTIITDKKAKAAWRRSLDLHTLLIMEAHGLSKPDAVVQAYHETVDGLKARRGVVEPVVSPGGD